MLMIDVDIKPYVVADLGGRVIEQDGQSSFQPESQPRYRSILDRCIGQYIRLRIIRQKRQRTPEQNRYYWGLVLPDILHGLRELAESVGELPVFTDEDDLHEALKWAFLRRMYVLPGAGELEAMPRSSKLSIAEFSEYVDKVRLWAAERKIYVRMPGEEVQV